jgi:nicotinamide phosphoribosyltransferase
VRELYEARVAQVLGEVAAAAIGTDHIAALHQLGYLPLRFCSLPEGTLVPIGVPCFTVENTHDDFAWLTNYIETGLSAGIWQAQTSATIAHEYRKVLEDAARRTGANLADVDYQLHDFSYRGMSSHETAAASGAAHLLSFMGTDSLVALDFIDRFYGGEYVANSVPATEHSCMSAGTAVMGEFETYERLLDLYPTGTVAIVSDTYDLWRVLTDYLPRLKDKILARDGRVVCRPDSGDPERILCGDPDAGPNSPASLGVVRLLYKLFGGYHTQHNQHYYLHLDPHIGVIYGDSITIDRAKSITMRLREMGFASTNVIFGVGSYTYQMNTRDTFGSAMKATWVLVDGKPVNIFKDPVTDDGTKKSATGRLAVHRDHGELVLLQQARELEERTSLLQPVWEDGKFLRRQTFAEVRKVLEGQG